MKSETMTVQDCCDWVAHELGADMFVRDDLGNPMERVEDHPFPPTIDAAAAAMPEGWQIQNIGFHIHGVAEKSVQAFATKGDWRLTMREGKEVSGTRAMGKADTELLARWRLVVACMMASEEQDATNGSR